MLFRRLRKWNVALALVVAACAARSAVAAPRIGGLSLRGLQAGGVTKLVIDGAELGPETKILCTAPLARTTIQPGATLTRLEVELAVDAQVPAGIYLLRVASDAGISDAVPIGVDNLPQIALVPKLSTLDVAMTGALNGSTVLSTSFTGKKGQVVLAEVESRRLGAMLNPVLQVYDARRVQLGYSRPEQQLDGDARVSATLPADGDYTIELHDSLFRGADPGFFRLKVGQFHYADLVFPLGVQQGTAGTFEFASTNLPTDARGSATWTSALGLPLEYQPAPWPAGVPLVSGSRPRVIASNHAEIVEAPPADKPQEIPAAPVAINGRLDGAGQQDRYRLAVTPGSTLKFDVLARRVGSPLDAVLSIQNEQGAELAANDDRPETNDPGLDFKVPDGTSAVIVAVRDLAGRGGAEFVYRIAVEPAGQPDFSLSLTDERYLVPRDGAALLRVRAQRAGYNGPIKLEFADLPPSVSTTLAEIPSGASEALVTLAAPGLSPAQSLCRIIGASSEPNTAIRRLALSPRTSVNRYQPWLGEQVALAVTTPSPIVPLWEPMSADARLALGTGLPVKLRVERAAGVTGAVRLSLLTTQAMPRKKTKVNNQDREVDDVERALRFESSTPTIVTPTIAADKSELETKVTVPADLAAIPYDLAIQAELLAADNKQVVATAVTPARRFSVTTPIALELAATEAVEARAGVGPTGSVKGKIQRAYGYNLPVAISLAGLPKGAQPPSVVVPGDKSEFELPLALPYGLPAGKLEGVKIVGTSQVDLKNPKLVLRTSELPLAVTVVPGEKPAEKPSVEKPLAIFEDQAEFVANLKDGGGTATLFDGEKYSGAASVKVTPDQRFNPALPGLGVKIREKPGPGEFRYLQFAWKKQGGGAICLQLNHDGQWGPTGDKPAKFRYHAGGGGECFGASLGLDANLPAGFTLVTRDLFADFGEFTLTGLALSPIDGDYALFDHIYLGATPEDFNLVKP